MKKQLKNRISEILLNANRVEEYYCDFESTVDRCIWDLSIEYNDRFVWLSYGGTIEVTERYLIASKEQCDDLRWELSQHAKGIRNELKSQGLSWQKLS